METNVQSLIERIIALRDISEISTSKMAELLGIKVEQYMKYEAGEEDFPVGVIMDISTILDVDLTVLLTGEEPKLKIFSVTRAGKGVKVNRREQYSYQSITSNFTNKKVETFIVEIEPNSNIASLAMNSHPGQEFNYVLEGSVKYYIHKNELILNAGDSIYFDSSYEHAMQALDGSVKLLVVVM